MSELPEGVRRRVVDIAAERLGNLPPEEVPASLRPFARFAPGRRRQVILPIAAALENDEAFRLSVGEAVREGLPDLAAALENGGAVPAADPDDVAAAAYLLRSPGWEDLVARAAEREAATRSSSAVAAEQREADRRRRSADAEVASLRSKIVGLEAQVEAALAEVERERRRARDAADRARRADAALKAAVDEREASQANAGAAAEASALEVRRLRDRLVDAEATLDRLRRDSREAREAADVRRWLLLDTLARAVAGLREELSPAPPTRRPADLVEAAGPPEAASLSLAPEDPATVDLLLSLPHAHLVVDGYNVTKTGYPDLTLEDQRVRLVSGLAALAARTSAEVTCVFDGAEVSVRVPAAAARRVRVRFSPAGQTADELIRRLVRAEPTGRPVSVCSADREVVEGVRRAGARVVAPVALLARLDRA